MRLTLRTLLAYRDGVLRPAEAEDLHHRVQQSEDAGNLLKRINSVTKRAQVPAPALQGKGLGGDPNAIAEYLDDVLHGPKVPELERICLESDVQLAELAHCHELLSSAMHTQIGVPDSLRKLAVDIGDADRRQQIQQGLLSRNSFGSSPSGAKRSVRVDAAHDSHKSRKAHQSASSSEASDVAVQVQAPMVASGGESIRPQGLSLEGSQLGHEVPEYLVGTSRGSWRIPLAIGALVALLGVLVWQSLGPWDQVLELFAAVPAEVTPGQVPDASARQPEAAAGEKGENDDPATDPIESDETYSETAESPPGSVAPPDGQPKDTEGPSDSADGNSGESATAQPGDSDQPADTDREATDPPAIPGQATWLPKDDDEIRAVLLARSEGVLRRLQPGESISVGSSILVPPTSRTTIELPGGVLWTACGPTRMKLISGEAPQPPGVETSLCRSLLRGGPEGQVVRLVSPVGECAISLADSASRASVEVAYRPTAQGSVVDRRAFKPILVVVAVEGEVAVDLSPGRPQAASEQLALGQGLAIVEDEKPKRFVLRPERIPPWYASNSGRPIDGLAAEDLGKLLQPQKDDPNIESVLVGLTTHRRPETAALAVQTALLAGDWQPLTSGFLENPRLRSHWSSTLDLARQLLAIDPAGSGKVQNLFVQSNGPIGNTLFQLLCGLPEDQLVGEGLANLVSQLENGDLGSRVLAAYQLKRLTGRVLGYQPHAPNRASVQQWRRELAMSRLELQSVGDPIWERIPN